MPSRTSPCHSAEHRRLVSTPKGQEEPGFHTQEINQCRGKGYYIFLSGFPKCCEALLFKVSYIIQDSSPYISSWSRKAARFLHSFYQVNALILQLFLEMQLILHKIIQIPVYDSLSILDWVFWYFKNPDWFFSSFRFHYFNPYHQKKKKKSTTVCLHNFGFLKKSYTKSCLPGFCNEKSKYLQARLVTFWALIKCFHSLFANFFPIP